MTVAVAVVAATVIDENATRYVLQFTNRHTEIRTHTQIQIGWHTRKKAGAL